MNLAETTRSTWALFKRDRRDKANHPYKMVKRAIRFMAHFIRWRRAKFKSITVISDLHTKAFANQLVRLLAEVGYAVDFSGSVPKKCSGDTLYFVLCPQAWKRLPRNRVVLQMEQYPNNMFFNFSWIAMLMSSLAIFDFSKRNIELISSKYPFYRKALWLPVVIEFDSERRSRGAEKEFDFVFFGAINERRKKVLDHLSARFSILRLTGVYGDALYAELARAKACINIHYYDAVLLETMRISEVVAMGLPVVSELSVDQDDYPWMRSVVKFCDLMSIEEVGQGLEAISNSRATEDEVFARVTSESVSKLSSVLLPKIAELCDATGTTN